MIVYLLAGVAALAIISGLAYKTYQAGADSARLECAEGQARQRAAEAVTADKAAVNLEAKRERTRIVYRTVTQQVDRLVTQVEYRDKPCLEPRGLCIVNAAIGGTDASACVSDPTLPKPAASD